jgi:hypothetical protein
MKGIGNRELGIGKIFIYILPCPLPPAKDASLQHRRIVGLIWDYFEVVQIHLAKCADEQL